MSIHLDSAQNIGMRRANKAPQAPPAIAAASAYGLVSTTELPSAGLVAEPVGSQNTQ